MNDLLVNYKEDILQLFKNHYRRMIAKTVEINFEDVLASVFRELNISLNTNNESDYLLEWFNNIHHHLFLKETLTHPFLEIIFHSHQDYQIVSLGDKQAGKSAALSKEEFQTSLEVMALKHNVCWNFNDPFVSFNLTLFGTVMRATLIHHSTSANQHSKLFLRKILSDLPRLEMFKLEESTHGLMLELMAQKKNILISGGTGSGKTTFLRSLINQIPIDEHLVVLEDTYEILHQHPGQTSFLAIKDQPGKTLKDYCAYSLRMSPDRILVGEMRSNEVVPFLLAMNTGHKGLMSTIHASSGADALNRIALLFSLFSESADLSYSLIMKLVCKNIDYVVHMENKKVKEICRVIGSEGETPFYEQVL